MDMNRQMQLMKFITSSGLVVELDDRADHVDAEILGNLIGLLHANAETHSSVSLDRTDRIMIEMNDSVVVGIPRTSLQGLESATATDAAKMQIEGPGTGIFPILNVAHYIPGLLEGIFGTRKWTEYGRRGGLSQSTAKSRAARENGKKGGRPKRTLAKS